MATSAIGPAAIRPLIIAAIVAAIGIVGFLAWQRYDEKHVVAKEEDGSAVTQLVTARLSGMSSLKVAELSGTVQSSASDVRGFGWLRADQVVKMPYSVDYFVDMSRLGAADVQWIEASRTLIVDAPDIAVARPNTDEGRRSLVRTTGLFVTREAAEELSRRTSLNAAARAGAEAGSPERMAQAREHARRAIANLLSTPLSTLGYGDARVIVTFPPERTSRDGERWDVSPSIEQVLSERKGQQ